MYPDESLAEYLRRRFNELEELRDLNLPLLGGLPFLKGRFRASADIDLLAPYGSENHVRSILKRKGYDIIWEGCTPYGKMITARKGRSIVDVMFSPFYEMHDVGEQMGPYIQVSREWDYCFITFFWRGVFKERLLRYLRSGIVEESKLKETILTSPFRELIVAYADDELVPLLPENLLNWRNRLMKALAFWPPVLRLVRRYPSWILCYILTRSVRGILSNIKTVILSLIGVK